jgi:ATP-binding cassette, subfamily A (ABC1), member 2
VLLTIIMVWGQVITYTDPLLLFVFLELFVLSTITLAFAISVFFSKSRLAAACAGIIYFVLYLPYVFISINQGWHSLSNGVFLFDESLQRLAPSCFVTR